MTLTFHDQGRPHETASLDVDLPPNSEALSRWMSDYCQAIRANHANSIAMERALGYHPIPDVAVLWRDGLRVATWRRPNA